MATGGEHPVDLAARLPDGSYDLSAPIERSGLIFGHVRHDTGGLPLEAGITPEADVLSVHRTTFDGSAWREGRLIHSGPIRAGSVSLVQAGVRSDVRLTGSVDIVQVFVPQEIIGALAAEIYGKPVHLAMDGWVSDRVLEELAIATMVSLRKSDAGARLEAEVLALRLAEHLLSKYSVEHLATDRMKVRRGGLAPWQMRRLFEFMDANLDRDLHLKDLAAQVNLSPFHFVRAFRHETHVTPHQWLVRRRISRAKALLSRSDLPIAEIAGVVGYASQSSMTAAFSQLVGVSPLQWRRQRR